MAEGLAAVRRLRFTPERAAGIVSDVWAKEFALTLYEESVISAFVGYVPEWATFVPHWDQRWTPKGWR